MTNKTILFSFIWFSISTVFSITSIVFLCLFDIVVSRTRVDHMCPACLNCYCLNVYYTVFNSNIQMLYFPGLIFFGISLLFALEGIIAFIVIVS